jgi:DNA processing protein
MLRTPGLGSKTIQYLLQHLEPAHVFAASRSQLSALGLKQNVIENIKGFHWSAVDPDLAWLDNPDNFALTLQDPRYPAQLLEIDDPPPVLFVRGNLELLSRPQIAIVGSRNPSAQGLQTAQDFARALARFGFTITSGLALGIDAASHQGALQAQGHTIAVAGTGPDRVYPARHKELANEIIKNGAIISEFPPGTSAQANHFPRRNRIISGLCLGLLVVEAAKQSGSLITARLALEQNREVFAIPGSIHNPLARGCNALIREGAKLVETSADILEELGEYNQQHEPVMTENLQSELDLEQQNLLNLVDFSPTSVDYLVKKSDLAVEIVSSILLQLELQGYISSVAGGCYMRIQ